MFRYVATIPVGILLSAPLVAGITPFLANFHTQMVTTNGTSLYVRVGGRVRSWCCCMASVIRVICGPPWQLSPEWKRHRPSSDAIGTRPEVRSKLCPRARRRRRAGGREEAGEDYSCGSRGPGPLLQPISRRRSEEQTFIHDLAVLAMRVRKSSLPAVGSIDRLPENQLARPVVPADLLNRKCLIAGAASHFLYLRPMEPNQVTYLNVGGVSRQGIGLRIALSLNLEAIRATGNTALQGVMTVIDLNKDDRADHSANPDCGCGDLGPGRT
jgi:hypothetical protein